MPTLVSRYQIYRKFDPPTGEDLCNQQKRKSHCSHRGRRHEGGHALLGRPCESKWECAEKDGWLGFVCRASTAYDHGAYLGHDNHLGHDSQDVLVCKQLHHRDDEYFQVVLHDEGFAWVMRRDNRNTFIGIAGDGCRLKPSAKGTTWWGFTAIDGSTVSYAPSARSLSVDALQMKLVLHW